MQAAAIDWARQNPKRVLELAGIKFLRMWSPLPNATEFGSTTLRLVLAVSYLASIAFPVMVREADDWAVVSLLIFALPAAGVVAMAALAVPWLLRKIMRGAAPKAAYA